MEQVPLPTIPPPDNRGSYVVQFHIHEARIIKTDFAPGYTPAHCATPEEAVEAARVATQRIIDQHVGLLEFLDELSDDPKVHKSGQNWKTTPPRFKGPRKHR